MNAYVWGIHASAVLIPSIEGNHGSYGVVNSAIIGDAPYATTTLGHHMVRLGKLFIWEPTNLRLVVNSTIVGDAPYTVTHLSPLPKS